MATIHYAVIALTRGEAEDVSRRLRAAQGMAGVAAWFDANKAALYGRRSDDWKPFGGRTIDEMLNEGEHYFNSLTNLVDNLEEPFGDLDDLLESGIEVYFIDVFALFLDRYRNLATRLDAALARTENCCFVLPYGMSGDSETLLAECSRSWPTVFRYYSRRGALHRVAVRAAELTNVRSYCLKRASGGPNPGLASQVTQRLGNNPKEVPRIAATV